MSYDGIIVGSPTFGPGGKFSGCVSGFRTADSGLPRSYIRVLATADVQTQTGITIEFWYKVAPAQGFGVCLTCVASTAAVYVGNNLDWLLADSNWHHLAFTSNPFATYLDGTLIPNFSLDPTGVSLILGAYQTPSYDWPGAICEFAVWNEVRYTADFTPPTAPYTGTEINLRALYPLTSDALNYAASTQDPVLGQPEIALNPASVTAAAGQTVTFIAAASGTPTPTIQWRTDNGTSGATLTNISGATSNSYSTVATTAQEYRAVFTNTLGSVTSAAAVLTIASLAVASIQSQVLAAAVTALGAIGDAPAYRSKMTAFSIAQLPARNVLPEDGETEYTIAGVADRKLRFSVRHTITAADEVDAAVDPLYCATGVALLADLTLGGLVTAIREVKQKWEMERGEQPVVALVVTYEAEFSTSRSDPSVRRF